MLEAEWNIQLHTYIYSLKLLKLNIKLSVKEQGKQKRVSSDTRLQKREVMIS